jgi:hypothetical protein
MSLLLPREITVEPDRQGVRYRLPTRDTGCLRVFALIPIGFGLCFSGFAVFWMLGATGLWSGRTPGVGDWLFGAFGIPFFLVGLAPVALGMFVLAGRCEVELDGRMLRVTEKSAIFRWRLKRLLVSSSPAEVNGKPVTKGPLADVGALVADYGTDKPALLVLGYPRQWLAALAADLAQRLRAQGIEVTTEEGELSDLATAAGFGLQNVNADQPVQPVSSTVKVESRPDGTLFTVPPMGLMKGSKGLFIFAVIWCGFITIFTVLAGPELLKKGGSDLAIFAVISSLFWAVGLGMLAGAVNMGRRRAMILVSPAELKVVRQGPFGTKKRAWSRGEIARIEVGPSGMTVNNRPVKELQVHDVNGSKSGFFTERDDEELRWLATTMRATLQLPPENVGQPTDLSSTNEP